MTASIVIFFFNEECCLPSLRLRVDTVRRALRGDCELVLVDDCSTDCSGRIARDWVSSVVNAQYVKLSRNFGSHAAVAAGLSVCTGDCAIIMAADLQDPPELIPDLIAECKSGFDVVWACRT